MFSTPSTRIPNGVTNAAPWQTMANAGVLDPSWAHVFHNDFDTYRAAEWTASIVGSGSADLAVGFIGGGLAATTSSGSADSNFYQLVQATFQLTVRETMHFKYSGVLSDVTNDVFYAGLLNKGSSPLTATDGLVILKPTGQSGLLLQSIIGGVTTSLPFPANMVLVAGVPFELGIEVDYLGNVAGYFNPGTGGAFTGGTIVSHPGRQVTLPSTLVGLTQVALTPSFGLMNSTASAKTLTTDYITVAGSR